MFIQIETTPDPAVLKFLPGRDVLGEGMLELHDSTEAANSPLARRLFEIPDVTGVVLGSNFITVTKNGGNWQHLKPAILGAIMDHFASGAPVLVQSNGAGAPETGEDGLVGRLREALRQVIDPELGYNIVDLGLVYGIAVEEGGVARVTMTTTTVGCPATNYLVEGARDAAEGIPEIKSAEVALTYDPHWTPEMMSAEAKAYLGIGTGGGW